MSGRSTQQLLVAIIAGVVLSIVQRQVFADARWWDGFVIVMLLVVLGLFLWRGSRDQQ